MARPMTRLEAYAQHGSCSYSPITAERLRAILLGATPVESEMPSVGQALLETPATGLYHDPAAELAAELGMSLEQLETRCIELTGEKLGSSSHAELARQATALDDGT